MGEPLSARIERKNEKKGFHKKPPNQTNAWKENGERKRNGVWVAPKNQETGKVSCWPENEGFLIPTPPFPSSSRLSHLLRKLF